MTDFHLIAFCTMGALTLYILWCCLDQGPRQ